MHLTVMIPGALVPAETAAEFGSASSGGALARRLARATLASSTIEETVPPDEAWIARELFAGAQTAPTAPYAWTELGGDPVITGQVWHADPVYMAAGLDSVVLQSIEWAPPTASETETLIAAAAEHVTAAACRLERLGVHWFLHTARRWAFNAASLSAAVGRPLPLASSDDDDALAWSRLHNMIQMSWHEHPVNVAREERGLPVINGVWLHGGGTHRALPRLRWSLVASDRAEVRGAARAAGAAVAVGAETCADNALLVWDEALLPSRAQDWTRWRDAMVQVEQRLETLPAASELELILTGRKRIKHWRTRASDRLRLWRTRTLAEVCAE